MDEKIDKIFSITILDFNGKIVFYHKISEFNYIISIQNTRTIYKSLKKETLKDYIAKQLDYKMLDTTISSSMKVKVCLLGEIIIIILYSPSIDIRLFNLYAHQMIDAFYNLFKTKKIKVEMIVKRFEDISMILVDALYFINPNVRLENKNCNINQITNQDIYFNRFNKASNNLGNNLYFQSSKNFTKARDNLFYSQNMKYKLQNTKFIVNDYIKNLTISKKNLHISQYKQAVKREEDSSNNNDFKNIDKLTLSEHKNNSGVDSFNFDFDNHQNEFFNFDSPILNTSPKKKQSHITNNINNNVLNTFDFFSSNNNSNNYKNKLSLELDKLPSYSNMEDIFDKNTINTKIKCLLYEKGILLYDKTNCEDSKYRGRILLELKNNFKIKYKKLKLTINHNLWNDNNCFFKSMNKSLITNNNLNVYDILCKNLTNNSIILEYTPNSKIIDNFIKFHVNNIYQNEQYILNFEYQINKEFAQFMNNTLMTVSIITKNENINIIKENTYEDNYIIEDKKINFEIKNFQSNLIFNKKIIFNTDESNFIEVIKVNCKYVNILPTKLDATIEYNDQYGNACPIILVKKCLMDVRISL